MSILSKLEQALARVAEEPEAQDRIALIHVPSEDLQKILQLLRAVQDAELQCVQGQMQELPAGATWVHPPEVRSACGACHTCKINLALSVLGVLESGRL